MRTVVIGASSGIGRCIAVGLANRGARVALLARRKQMVEEAAQQAGEGSIPVVCDVTDEDSCRSAISEAADGLGGIDALVYSSAIGPLVPMIDTDAATWRRVFDTNVIGAALATAAAVPHLQESRGTAIYLASVAGHLTAPWPGLGPYATSKAALRVMVDAWRAEHPEIGFTTLTLGDCLGGEGDSGTQMHTGWDPDLTAKVFPTWLERGYLSGAAMDVNELVTVVDTLIRTSATAHVPSLSVLARPTPSEPSPYTIGT